MLPPLFPNTKPKLSYQHGLVVHSPQIMFLYPRIVISRSYNAFAVHVIGFKLKNNIRFNCFCIFSPFLTGQWGTAGCLPEVRVHSHLADAKNSKAKNYDNFAFASREWTFNVTVNFTFNSYCLELLLVFSRQFSQLPYFVSFPSHYEIKHRYNGNSFVRPPFKCTNYLPISYDCS